MGTVIMTLVILTDKRPYAALGLVLRRVTYLTLPLSVLFIRYFPDLGRAYHMGRPSFTGITFHKNGLGILCLTSGIYFCWHFLFKQRTDTDPGSRLHYSIYLLIVPMIVWLFYMANSATSLACMFAAICLLLIGRLPRMEQQPSTLVAIGIIFLVVFGVLEALFGVTDTLIFMLGRREDLTTRIPTWNILLSMVENPIVGFGYEIFWAGDRLSYFWNKTGTTIISAHNGYLDTYLTLGIIGLSLLLLSIIAGLIKAIKRLRYEYKYALLRITFIIVCILQNWTESTLKTTCNMVILFLFGILDMPTSMAQMDPKTQTIRDPGIQ